MHAQDPMFETLLRAAQRAKALHGWRYGQAVFNTALALLPMRTERLRGAATDPFYDDSRVPAFLDAL